MAERSPKRGRRMRLRLVLLTLPLVLIALVFAGKLFSLPVITSSGISAYDGGQWKNAAQGFERLDVWNAFEPWIAHFNRGTAHAAGGEFTKATDELSTALELAPDERRCDVRVNLALAWEQQGDAYAEAGHAEGAAKLWQAALAVIAAGEEEGCFEPQESGADDELKTAEQRLLDKLEQSGGAEQGQPPGGDESGDDESDSGGDAFDELDQRGKDAEREKQDGDSERRGNGGGDDTDKPW